MVRTYRKLTGGEITSLQAQGCTSTSWDMVEVSEGFSASNIRYVRFSGNVRIGDCCEDIIDPDGIRRSSGIYNAEIINSTIGDNAFISNIGSYIANYDIGDRVIIENVGKIVCRGITTFGNGVEVCTINEGGGREVPIFNGLSAQTAYIIAMYRHRPEMVSKMYSLINGYCQTVKSDRGTIHNGARISGCETIQDVIIGEQAVIDCADALVNGTIGSSVEMPSYIGPAVIMRDFITTHAVYVSGGTALYRCFVGEGCKFDHGFTASDSLFFSNSHLDCGETASIFAGPYTVSHHKSSLLIAGYFLFYNAGSGTNQSNHLFKTGAVHQGIHERGCKFGSNAYVMLPAREGAFTAILGKHFAHHDTSNFPYSYLMEEEGRSFLHPGVNLQSYGTKRDIEKWPKRDGRSKNPIDRINFEEYNPYIGKKLLDAVSLCRRMLAKEGVEVHNYHRLRIKTIMLKRGYNLYLLAVDAMLGGILEKGYKNTVGTSLKWIDAAGMFISSQDMDSIIDTIENDSSVTIEKVEAMFDHVYHSYQDKAYSWALNQLKTILGHEPDQKEIEEAISKGVAARATIEKLRNDDAMKEAENLMSTGYGIDSDDKEVIATDFRTVRKLNN